MEVTQSEVEAIEDYLEFTPEQVKALTNLKKAFTRCRKLGIAFWDNYGSFTAYPGRKMTQPVPGHGGGREGEFDFQQGERAIQCGMPIREAGYTAGNSDDTCQFDIKGKTLKQIMADYYEGEEYGI